MAYWADRSVSVTTLTAFNRNLSEDDSPISTLSSYELAYHHHLQTALQMGQFYNSEHHLSGHQQHSSVTAAATAALLRGSSSSSASVSAMNQSPALMNAGLGGNGPMNNCLGGLAANSLWDSGLIPGIQRGSANIGGYPLPHVHQHQANEVQANAMPHPCEIWTGGAASAAPVANGRGQRSGQHKSSSKKPRRRVATMAQRRAANIRERRRMFNLNEAFDKLRRKVPTFAYEKRLSRIETLRLAITYISFMGDILSVPDDTRNGLVGKSHSGEQRERKGSSSISTNNHHGGGGGGQYGLMNTRGGGSNNGAAGAGLLPGIDCHQNQNVPPAISPFAPLARMYSHHPSSTSYLHPNIHH